MSRIRVRIWVKFRVQIRLGLVLCRELGLVLPFLHFHTLHFLHMHFLLFDVQVIRTCIVNEEWKPPMKEM